MTDPEANPNPNPYAPPVEVGRDPETPLRRTTRRYEALAAGVAFSNRVGAVASLLFVGGGVYVLWPLSRLPAPGTSADWDIVYVHRFVLLPTTAVAQLVIAWGMTRRLEWSRRAQVVLSLAALAGTFGLEAIRLHYRMEGLPIGLAVVAMAAAVAHVGILYVLTGAAAARTYSPRQSPPDESGTDQRVRLSPLSRVVWAVFGLFSWAGLMMAHQAVCTVLSIRWSREG